MLDTLIVKNQIGHPWTVFLDTNPRKTTTPAIPAVADTPAVAAVLEDDVTYRARMVSEHVPPGHLFAFTSKATLPKVGPPAWAIDWATGNVTVKIPTLDEAKTATLYRLRQQRAPLFAALDAQFMIAVDTGQSATTISAKRQALRDITKLVAAATTQAQLDAIQVSL